MTPVERHDPDGPEALVAAVLARNPVIDGHNDLLWHARKHHGYDWDQFDVGGDLSTTGVHTDLQRLRAGGVGAQFWSVYVPGTLPGRARSVTATFEQIDAVHALISRYTRPARRSRPAAADVRGGLAERADRVAARRRGRPPDRRLARRAASMQRRSACGYLTLTHNDNIAVGRLGHRPSRRSAGSPTSAARWCAEMNRIGMLVDL